MTATLSKEIATIAKDMVKCEGVACLVARTVKSNSGAIVEIVCPVKKSSNFKALLENGFLTTAKLSKIGAYKPAMCVTTDTGTTTPAIVSAVVIDNTSKEIVVKVHDREDNDMEFKFPNSDLSYMGYLDNENCFK